jgi:hypothetical protein
MLPQLEHKRRNLTMATRTEKKQKFIRWYRDRAGNKEIDMHDVARAAKEMGWELPIPPDPLDILAKQFSEAAGEETRNDKKTRRVYKAQLAITERRKNGAQTTLWLDVDDDPPRHRIEKGLKRYREQMVGEAVIGSNTAEHWNSAHPDQRPLKFVTDLTSDVNERLRAPEEDDAAS